METKTVTEHTCFQKEHPLSPVKCRCRKQIPETDAADKVLKGIARYTVAYKDVRVEEICHICGGLEKEKLSCLFCEKTGKAWVTKRLEIEGDGSIIITVEDRGRKQASTIKKKTPRSPTIESGHIERALNDPTTKRSQDAMSRIEEYEMLVLKERIKLLVANYDKESFDVAWKMWETDPSQKFPLPFRQEPSDDPATGSGRRYDYGRSV